MQVTSVSHSGTTSIDALLGGTKWGGARGTAATVSYSFPYSGSTNPTWISSYSDDNEPAYAGSYTFSATHQAAAQAALQQWANVANLTFTSVSETSTNVGDIRFAFTATSALSSSWGWAYFPSSGLPQGGDIWINPEYIYDDWGSGSYNFASLLHEIGHALGFKHSFGEAPILPTSQDSSQYTVMSYTEHPHSLYREVTDQGGGYYSWTYYDVQPTTPMLYDIAAIQYLYGANTSSRTGDDTYSFDPATPFFMTIWDAGGTDTLTVSNFSAGCNLDLRAGAFSKVSIPSDPLPAGATSSTTATYDGTDNLAIAYGVTIENAIGGSGNDSLRGNEANNRLTGGRGNDSLNGDSGTDTAVFGGNRSSFTVTATSTGFTVSSSSEGTDTITAVERLDFTDTNLAFDLDGAAGSAARIIGAAFGAQYLIPEIVGVGISVFDGGMTEQQVAELALGTDFFTLLAGSRANSAVVTQLYRSVVGVAPDTSTLNYFVGLLNGGMSQAELLVLAANTDLTAQQINLTGLVQTGISYV